MRKISYQQWRDRFHPVENTIVNNAPFDGLMFETFGEELRAVKAAPQLTVWTLVEYDGKESILSGYHLGNRLGHFITAEPFNEEVEGDSMEVDA